MNSTLTWMLSRLQSLNGFLSFSWSRKMACMIHQLETGEPE